MIENKKKIKFPIPYPQKTKNEVFEEIQKSKEVWNNYVASKNKLYDYGLLKTFKQPESGFAEWITCKLYNGIFPYRSNNKYYDIECEDKKIEVKSISRQLTINNSYFILGKDRENIIATHFAFVYYRDFIPNKLILVKTKIIKEYPLSYINLSELKKNSEEIHDLSSFFKL